jgi:hypothetical protein
LPKNRKNTEQRIYAVFVISRHARGSEESSAGTIVRREHAGPKRGDDTNVGMGSLGTEEHEPDNAEDQDGKAGGNSEERKHRRSGLGLPRFGRGFNNLPLSLRRHDGLNPVSGQSRLFEVPAPAPRVQLQIEERHWNRGFAGTLALSALAARKGKRGIFNHVPGFTCATIASANARQACPLAGGHNPSQSAAARQPLGVNAVVRFLVRFG